MLTVGAGLITRVATRNCRRIYHMWVRATPVCILAFDLILLVKVHNTPCCDAADNHRYIQ